MATPEQPPGGLLAAAQYSDVALLGVGGEAKRTLAPFQVDDTVPVVPPNFPEVVRPPKQWLRCVGSDKRSQMAALKAAQMVLVCTHRGHTEDVAALLLEAFPLSDEEAKKEKMKRGMKANAKSKKNDDGNKTESSDKTRELPREPKDEDVAIVCLNYGVSASKELWQKLDGLVTPDFLSGSACFEVTYSASQKALTLLVRGALVLRRLPKNQIHCEKFLDLLSTTAIKLLFTHDPLHHSWGCMSIVSALTVPPALTSTPVVAEALCRWKLRLVCAAVLFEVTEVLTTAFSMAQKSSQERRAASGDVSRRKFNREAAWRPSPEGVTMWSFRSLVAILSLAIPEFIFEKIGSWLIPLEPNLTAVAQWELRNGSGDYVAFGLKHALESLSSFSNGEDEMPATVAVVRLFQEAVQSGQVPNLSADDVFREAFENNDTLTKVQREGRAFIIQVLLGICVVLSVIALLVM